LVASLPLSPHAEMQSVAVKRTQVEPFDDRRIRIRNSFVDARFR
jgi:hypothetical protein